MEQDKKRKPYKGVKNNKERTMKKLLDAVGIVLKEKGYTGLTATNIAKKAGVDRKLISLYFESTDKLIETYIRSKDYWLNDDLENMEDISNLVKIDSKAILEQVLLQHLRHFRNNEEMQKAITWQISESSDIMSQITREREKLSSIFFTITDGEFDENDIDLRATIGLIVSGIYYLVLHAKHTDSTVCDLELNDEGFERIQKAISKILELLYERKSKKV